jgi:hypothetical protein
MAVQHRVFFSITAVVLAIVAFQCIYFPHREIALLRRHLDQKTHLLGQVIAMEIAPGIQFEDQEAIMQALQAAALDQDVVWAAAFGPDGKLLSSYGKEPVDASLHPAFSDKQGFRELGDTTWSTFPVQTKTGTKATLGLRISRRAITAENTTIRVAAFMVGLMFLGIGLAVAFVVKRYLARMISGQRQLVGQIAQTAVQLNAAAGDFLSSASEQERGSSEQSSAVEETRRTMASLLESSKLIAETAEGVLLNAERTQANSKVVAERIAALSAHSQRITEISEVIKEIANKSDLLALNAALEGTKAGEAGRGFSLVATQMQRLAENVMGSVRNIKEITGTITQATEASVFATEESTKLAADTTASARQIAQVMRHQQQGTEQVTLAMDEVTKIALQSAEASRHTVGTSRDLIRLSETLQSLVGQFSIDDEAEGAPKP